jgi:hypothetical protein
MLPALSVDNSTDLVLPYSKSAAEASLRLAGDPPSPNLSDPGIGHFGLGQSLADRHLAAPSGVVRILAEASQLEMIRVNAGGIMLTWAVMQHQNARRNQATMEYPGDPVSIHHLGSSRAGETDPKLPMAALAAGSFPDPAIAGAIDVFPEELLDSLRAGMLAVRRGCGKA